MNPFLAAIVMTVPLSTAVSAQVYTPAPVPNRNFGTVIPSQRVARPDGSERSSPFAGLPDTFGASSGQASTAILGVRESDGALPSVSR